VTRRYLVGGPSNSGKSTFTLTLVAHLCERRGLSAEAIELDVWSRSFAAFRGETTFAARAKDRGLDWDWQSPLRQQIAAFNASRCDIVLADLPGQLDEAIAFICDRVSGAQALVVSRTLEGLDEWGGFFERHGVPVAQRCLTFLDWPPHLLVGLNRQVDPDQPDVAALGAALELPPDPDGQR
jgi:hypothetical protein